MAKKVYDSYRKTWFYEQDNGQLSLEAPAEAKPVAPKVEAPKSAAPKKKWWEIWK